MNKIPIKKLASDNKHYYPLSVLESIVTTHDINVEHDIGEYKKDDVIESITTLDEILTNLFKGSAITVDDHLDTESENPVQNKIITEALEAAGKVDTVNGIEPDENKNVQLPIDNDFNQDSNNPIVNSFLTRIMTNYGSFKFVSKISDGSEQFPYIIRDYYDLLALKESVDEGIDFAGKHFKQVCDIDMSKYPWEGIGLYADAGKDCKQFRGIYDGDNHQILNLKFKTPCEDTGFFNCVGDGGTIKNMIIRLADDGLDKSGFNSINSDYKSKDELLKAIPVGDPSTLYWVTEDTDQKKAVWYWDGTKYKAYVMGAGVLIGYAIRHVVIDNIKTYGNLGSEKLPCSHNGAGIIVGNNRVDQPFSTDQYIGLVMTNCESNVNIVGSYTKIGGIIAFNSGNLSMTDCTSTGNITSYYRTNTIEDGGFGGIIGNDGYSPFGRVWLENITSLGKITTRITIEDIVDRQSGYGSIIGATFQYLEKAVNVKYRNGQIAQCYPAKFGYSKLGEDGLLYPADSANESIQTCEHWDENGDPQAAGKKGRVLKLSATLPEATIDRSITKNTCVVYSTSDDPKKPVWQFAESEDLGNNKTRYYIPVANFAATRKTKSK